MPKFKSFDDLANYSKTQATSKVNFNHFQVLHIFRSMNYSLGQAVCDLIDNCIDADAKTIRITYALFNDGPLLSIIDDGFGIDEISIDAGMAIGVQREREKSELGKFGIGMKLSSLSKANTVTMISKSSDKKPVHRSLSWRHISKVKKVELLKNFDKELVGYMNGADISEKIFTLNSDHGTILLLSDMRKKYDPEISADKRAHTKECKYLASYIARTFEQILIKRKIKIIFNWEELKPLSPFFEDTENKTNPREGYQCLRLFPNFKNQAIPVDFILVPRTDLLKKHPNYKRIDAIKKYDQIHHDGVYVFSGYYNCHYYCSYYQPVYQRKGKELICNGNASLSNAISNYSISPAI